MNNGFSARLSELRKEKKVSQKAAAAALGVSQALLSHYEKGIRECGLDFLKRACEYYDVSSDYLLGLSDRRRTLSTGLDSDDLPGEGDAVTEILHRSAIKVCERAGMTSEEMEHCFKRLSTLSAYRTILLLADKNPNDRAWLTQALEAENLLAACILHHHRSPFKNDATDVNLFKDNPEMLGGLIASCEDFMKEHFIQKPKKGKKSNT
ncbi:MAG: helix-turn-helix transcriptional regulator [Oscillospiraceae bacterium]|jgi:transcriptional regulator with XRE-family HTH domain|nr:helix-turn-helix transcriptional regulator [Oscillospiraceae bacterium]